MSGRNAERPLGPEAVTSASIRQFPHSGVTKVKFVKISEAEYGRLESEKKFEGRQSDIEKIHSLASLTWSGRDGR